MAQQGMEIFVIQMPMKDYNRIDLNIKIELWETM